MSNKPGYFDIKRDMTFPYICEACLVGKDAKSPDPRYCQSCYAFLLKEASLLDSRRRRPAWIPITGTPHKPRVETLQSIPAPLNGAPMDIMDMLVEKEKTKMSTLNTPSLTVDKFRPGGRPKAYNKRQLPDDKIKQLHKGGMGTKAIATKLKKEHGINVTYKTIQRVLSGQR